MWEQKQLKIKIQLQFLEGKMKKGSYSHMNPSGGAAIIVPAPAPPSELLMCLEHQKEMEASLPEFPSFFLHTVFAKTRTWKWMSCRRVCRAPSTQKHLSMLPIMAAYLPTRSQIADILHGLTASWAKDTHYFGKKIGKIVFPPFWCPGIRAETFSEEKYIRNKIHSF